MNPAPMNGMMRRESHSVRDAPSATRAAPNTPEATAMTRPSPTTDDRAAR